MTYLFRPPSPTSTARATGKVALGHRKLHLGHFAFMRAVVQGIDLRDSWDRYLLIEGEHRDLRLVKATIAWIRDEFAAAAKRERRPGTARLVLIDPKTLGAPTEVLPSLQDFARKKGLEDFSQAEQLQAYEDTFGKATERLNRRGKLIERQLAALDWLEALIAEPPRTGDGIASWLNPTLTSRLQAAGIQTIAQLIERINGIGHGWHRSMAAIGPTKAARIQDWLTSHAASIGQTIGAHVAMPRAKLYVHELNAIVPVATDVRPLEKFRVPSHLDGSRGAYRQPQALCLLSATNDYEAILTWLRSKHGLTPEQRVDRMKRRKQRDAGVPTGLEWLSALSHTQRAYRKEAERFLLWAILERGKALSSMTQEDCIAYREFISDPQPRSTWCGSRARERWSPLWRPFEGPLSTTAQQHAITILKNLYRYLVDQNYLVGNPWSSVQVPRSSTPKVDAGRSFTVAQWKFVEQQLAIRDATSVNTRLRFTLHLLYATGLRLAEVVAAKVGDLTWVSYPADSRDEEPIEGWMLRVIGKGSRQREVPVPIDVVAELAQYLTAQGRDTDPEHPDNAEVPLLVHATDLVERAPGLAGRFDDSQLGGALAATTLYDQLKGFFTECANVLSAKGDRKGAERMAAASTHWMRHTHASHAIAGGMPIEIAQQNLGHSSLATTTVYVTTEKKKRLRAVEGFWEKRAG